ncbi:Plasmodium vivax Vir protein, putative [Plasmodium vivax]|uniref:Vir protein, putative n=1 Tax=Plasmodium vivax TaxID=5855 RepID=A0A1G4E317_PLAVI|nr:Plasmodium vivax Vir protein, putative [Plasmodium vivax]
MNDTFSHYKYESVRLFPKFVDVYNISPEKYEHEYVSDCDYINKQFSHENDNSFKIVCQKIGVFIKNLKEYHDLADKNGACKYLNYIINKEIREFNNSDYETNEFYDNLINKFDEKNLNLRTDCTESIKLLDKNVFENMGKLYTLYSSFHKYIYMDEESKDCNEIEKCVPLFKEYTQGCNGDRNDDFCNALLNFSNYAYSHNSVVMTCTGETSTFTLGLKRYTDEDGSVDESDFDTDISQNSVFIAFSIILVVSVTLFILYKFTPFGSFTRLKIHQNKKKFEKIQDRIHKIFRIHKHHLEDSNNNRFNMPYHPKQNYQLK